MALEASNAVRFVLDQNSTVLHFPTTGPVLHFHTPSFSVRPIYTGSEIYLVTIGNNERCEDWVNSE